MEDKATSYSSLMRVFTETLRHAKHEGSDREEDAPFEDQGICRRINRWTARYAFGEVEEKMMEYWNTGDVTKIYDALIYLAAVAVVFGEPCDDVTVASLSEIEGD